MYNALKSEQTGVFSYGKYFIHKAIFVGWCIWVFIAPPIGSASCFVAGFFVMIDQFSLKDEAKSKGTVGGIACIINIALWGITGFLAIFSLTWAFAIWKKGGGQRQLNQNVSMATKTFQSSTNSAAVKLFGGKPPN
mmetsp:Transcript_15013/g.38186  ORF Transcript_15013/g.38186 Transcript_15013/m.38186 type:complete len:136 (+) Transcript_15013:146-553(+)